VVLHNTAVFVALNVFGDRSEGVKQTDRDRDAVVALLASLHHDINTRTGEEVVMFRFEAASAWRPRALVFNCFAGRCVCERFPKNPSGGENRAADDYLDQAHGFDHAMAVHFPE